MVKMIMEIVGNCSFTLTTGNGKRSRLRRLKNGVPQGSVLTPHLLNIYISDLHTTVYRKYAYADDLAIMHADRDWQVVEGVMSKDMATVGEYLQTWKLKLSTTIVTGCLRPTPADNLPILAGIQPAELRRSGATLSLARRVMEPGHLLHSALTRSPSANPRRLKLRHPSVRAAQHLISLSDNNMRAAQWADG